MEKLKILVENFCKGFSKNFPSQKCHKNSRAYHFHIIPFLYFVLSTSSSLSTSTSWELSSPSARFVVQKYTTLISLPSRETQLNCSMIFYFYMKRYENSREKFIYICHFECFVLFFSCVEGCRQAVNSRVSLLFTRELNSKWYRRWMTCRTRKLVARLPISLPNESLHSTHTYMTTENSTASTRSRATDYHKFSLLSTIIYKYLLVILPRPVAD